MSHVVSILILSPGCLEHRGFYRVQSWLNEKHNRQLAEISEYAGGDKGITTKIWAGGFNYLDIVGFTDLVKEVSFDLGTEVFIKDENDSYFRKISIC